MNHQKNIKEQATGILKTIHIENLRGVIAFEGKNLNEMQIVYYFENPPTEDDLEEASLATTYILAALPMIDTVKEEFLECSSSKPLSGSDCWVFQKKTTQQ